MEAMLNIQVWLLRVAFLALAVVLGVAARRLPRPGGRAAIGGALVVMALTILAAVVRYSDSLWSVSHENALGYVILEDAARLDRFPTYGLGGHVLYNLAFLLAPDTPTSVFGLNFVLSVASVPLVFSVVRRLFASAGAGLVSAALLAAHPTHIRMSASENLFIPFLFFALLGLAALLWALDGERERAPWGQRLMLLVGAALSLALAVQIRPLGVVLALPAALVFLLHGGSPRDRLRSSATWVALVVGLVVVALHVVLIVGRMGSGGGEMDFVRSHLAPGLLVANLTTPSRNALIDPAVTPAGLLVLCGLGVLGMSLFDRRRLAILLPTAVVAVVLHTTFGENPVDQLRFHLAPTLWVVIVAGGSVLGVTAFARHFGTPESRLPNVLIAVLVAGALSGLLTHRQVFAARYDTQREFAFLSEAIPLLPKSGTLVRLGRASANGVLTTELPTSWMAAEGRRPTVLSAEQWLADPESAPRPVFWFRGTSCWFFVNEADIAEAAAAWPDSTPPLPLRPPCVAVEAAGPWRLVAELSFSAQPDRFEVLSPEITLGLYEWVPPPDEEPEEASTEPGAPPSDTSARDPAAQ